MHTAGCRSPLAAPLYTAALICLTTFLILSFSHCEAVEPAGTILSLSEGLKIATEENRVVKIATFNRELASQDIAIARSRFFPIINAQANYTIQAYQPGAIIGSISVRTADKDFPSFGINVHQTLFDFWARESLYSASRESFESTRLDIFRTRNLVALDFINAYFSLLESDKFVAVGQKEVEALESHLQMAGSLFSEGVITKNDLLQAEVRLSDARQRLVTLVNQRTFNASRINNILSRPLTREVTPVEVAEDMPPMAVLEKSWETAIHNRPEIKIINQDLKVNELRETAKKSEYFPTLFAEGGYNYSKNQFMLHEDNWTLMLGLNINLFSGGATRAEIARLKIRSEQIREDKRRLTDDIRLEVQRYYLDEKNARENVRTTKDAIRQAEENLRINKIRYKEGVGTATDVLDAISLMTLAEKNYYTALYDMRRAHAGLLYASGEDLTLVYK